MGCARSPQGNCWHGGHQHEEPWLRSFTKDAASFGVQDWMHSIDYIHPPTMWRSWIAWRRLLYLNRSNRLSPPALKPSVLLVFKAQSLCRLNLKVWLCLGITFADLNGKRFKLKGVHSGSKPHLDQEGQALWAEEFEGRHQEVHHLDAGCFANAACEDSAPQAWDVQIGTISGQHFWGHCCGAFVWWLVPVPTKPLWVGRGLCVETLNISMFSLNVFLIFHTASGTSCTHFHLNISILVLKHLLAIPCRHSLQLSTALMTYLWHKHLRILFPVQFALANKSKSEAAPKSCMLQW